MSATNLVLMGASLVLAVLFLQPRLLRASKWRATVTPLASIIGSGFLVAGPILAHAAGNLAWAAMLALCAIAYLFGAAIRHNIVHIEPGLRDGASAQVKGLERLSDFALSLAYFVSVAYYLNLFAAFGLRFADVTDPLAVRIAATVVIGAVGIVGTSGGLKALERLEVSAVGLKLGLIGGLLSALIVGSILAYQEGSFAWPGVTHARGTREIGILLGLVILVQGFETSRYLGRAYDTATRVRTMRWAQWISTGIYLVFVLLITRYFNNGLPAQGGETAIIDMLQPLGMALAPLVIVMALASQLSAAVADMNGAGGLLAETFWHKVKVRTGNMVTALVAIAITWAADIYQIITYASKAFVAYYALQCLQAGLSAWRRRQRVRAVLFLLGVVVALVVVLFAVPADA